MLSRPGRLLAGGGLALALALAPAASASAAPATAGALASAAALTDSVREQQLWVLQMLNVEQAWNVTRGAHVTVAVIDSGVDPNVSDLSGAVIPGPDFTQLKTSPDNPNWGQHGTWMASIIAGRGDGFDDQDGIIGVAPAATILSIRVIPDTTDPGYKKYDGEPESMIQDELADGIMEAISRHAQVISMSIGYSAPSAAVRAALQDAYSKGIVLVASSGNSGNNDEQHANHWAPVCVLLVVVARVA
jgi:subtilisin family serine protease